ncbi:PilZ domain-containing protein [Sphingomonas turrisvirgatae]|uniref:PilZ domain-containing protein n=1 Tax=Sphingomonas turrisvirgatae TaxID=1888892 RepID=A0A1E3LQV2_9SPHN|nr:PilZ domain-containing protein [Sphingomonas turrisvirgatae]ODP36141.1 hypothetical protein BFL28_06940 [Sphingomonas turrisvirgatae]
MAAISGQLDAPIEGASRRSGGRRTLHLRAQETAALGGAEVLVLDISTTGLLLQTHGAIAIDETIELELPGATPVGATVKWSNGQFYGCEFVEPVSNAFVSAALLRSPPQPAAPISMPEAPVSMPDAEISDPVTDLQATTGKLSMRVRLAVIAGLAVLSWAAVAAVVIALT